MCVWYDEYFLIIVNIYVVNGIGGLSFFYIYLIGYIINVICC